MTHCRCGAGERESEWKRSGTYNLSRSAPYASSSCGPLGHSLPEGRAFEQSLGGKHVANNEYDAYGAHERRRDAHTKLGVTGYDGSESPCEEGSGERSPQRQRIKKKPPSGLFEATH